MVLRYKLTVNDAGTTSMSQFDIVPNLREDWLKAKPYIIKALEHDDLYDIIDVECKIEDGTFLLWTGKQSAMVIEVLEFSTEKNMQSFILRWRLRRTHRYYR